MAITRMLIKANGKGRELEGPLDTQDIRELIGSDTLDTVQLKHMGTPRHVMFVDDDGHHKGLPINEQATRLYWANCVPGTTHVIVGDVVVLPSGELA